jgi:penicillin-binding protein 1A
MRAPTLPPPAAPRPRRKKRRSWLLGFLGFSFAFFMLVFVAGSAGVGYVLWQSSKDLPDYESLAKYEPPVMTRIHAHDGSLIAEYAHQRRIFVPINAVPKHVIAAFLSAEDKRFYDHGGLDFLGIARAAMKAAENRMKGRGGRDQGASTITQQVAKNFLLSNERSLERKIKEAILAVRIERAYTKDKILELYLNEIYLGIGAYGIAAAGLNYFNKELKDLTLEEAALLAAMPKGPALYDPRFERKRAIALERRNAILALMQENGYINEQQRAETAAKPIVLNLRPFGTHISAAEFFAEEVRRALLSQYGEEKLYTGGLSVRTTLDPKLQRYARQALINGLVKFDRERGGGWRGPVGRIEMTGDWGIKLAQFDQPTDIAPWRVAVVTLVERNKITVGFRPSKYADGSVDKARNGVEIFYDEIKWANKKPSRAPGPGDILAVGDVIWVAPKDPASADKPGAVWSLMQVPEVGGGLIAMDPHTGRVLAVAGGFSFGLSQFDRAIQAKRQPGSSFKTIVYAAAIDNGYKPTSIVLDAPIQIDQGPGKEAWDPKNYDGGSGGGPSTLRIGMEKSRNQMTVRLAQDMGMPLITEYSKRLGIYDDLLPVLSMSLGAGETTLLRMTTGYSIIANGGKLVRATLIDRIQDRWGKPVWRHDDRRCDSCNTQGWSNQAEPDIPDDRRQVLDPHTAYQMTSIMEGVVQRGTATIIKSYIPNVPVAGKTGTTNDEKDAWFVGYTPDLAVGVFIGYDTPKPMGKGATGGQLAAPVFGEFMKLALAERKAVPFRIPPGVRLVRVSSKTGQRSGGTGADTIMEAFKPGEEPDDAFSVIGFADQTATPGGELDQSQGYQSSRYRRDGGWSPFTQPGAAPPPGGPPSVPRDRYLPPVRGRDF